MNIDKDRVAADGLLYCMPWMLEARNRIAHRENRIFELEGLLNRCYEQGKAPDADEMDRLHIPLPASTAQRQEKP